MSSRKFRPVHIYGSLALIGLLTILIWPSLTAAMPLTAKHRLQRAWRLANDVGQYDYYTDVLQTTHRTERLVNVGRHAEHKRFVVSGKLNRHENEMYVKLRGLKAGVTLEIKSEDGRSFGRTSPTEEWVEADGQTELFAPGGDPMGYLVAAENVELLTDSQYEIDKRSPRYQKPTTIYRFDLSGQKYARFMKEKLKEQLQRQGELPAGIDLELAEEYLKMKGHGEIWLNGEGLPLRQIIHLEFPPEDHQTAFKWLSAEMTTYFDNWADTGIEHQLFWLIPRLIDNPRLLIDDPLSLLPTSRTLFPTPENMQMFGFMLGLSLLMLAIVLMSITHRKSQKYYAAVSLSVIVSMVFTPLIQANQLYDFNQIQLTEQDDQQTQQEQQKKMAELKAEISGRHFNPHQKPVRELSPGFREAAHIEGLYLPPAIRQAQNETTDEELSTNSVCDSNTDSDGDGLMDDEECYELGTDRNEVDSDGDGLSDYTEVMGFTASDGQHWYLDPLSSDSNGDGQSDFAECPNLLDVDITPSGTTCQNTDGDNIPDVFDYDNDGDGVSDSVDSSPTETTGLQSQLNLQLSNYQTDKSMLVEFQIRPTDVKYLWYADNVLDWPADSDGQIIKVNDTTFEDTAGLDSDYSSLTNASHGDMMVSAMLEILITPDESNPTGGLPVKSDYSDPIAYTDDIDNWLDQDALDMYGISVSQDEDYSLYVYVPLNILEDDIGDTPVAWSGQMFYRPTESSWGDNHQVRLLWMINTMTERCNTDDMTDSDDYDEWCDPDSGNWEHEGVTLVKTYYQDFYLTGFSVREDHGMEVAIARQTDAASAAYENNLWYLGNALQYTFLEGLRTTSSTGSRFDVAEVVRRFDKDSPTYGANAPERWGLSNLDFRTYSYDDYVSGMDALSDGDLEASLNDFGSVSSGTLINLLFIREEIFRSTSLDDDTVVTFNNSTLAVDLGSLDEEVYASINATPYQYTTDEGWESYDIEDYLDLLTTELANILTTTDLLTILDGASLADYDETLIEYGVISIAKNFYLTLYQSPSGVVETGNEIITDQVLDNDLMDLGDEEALLLIVGELATALQATVEYEIEVLVSDAIELATLSSLSAILEVVGTIEYYIAVEAGLVSARSGTSERLSTDTIIELSSDTGIESMIYWGIKKGYKHVNNIKGTSVKWAKNLNKAIGAVSTLATLGLLATVLFTDIDSDLAYTLIAALSLAAAITALVKSITTARKLMQLRNVTTLLQATKAVQTAQNISRATKFAAVIGFIIDVAIAIGIFLYAVFGLGIEPGSVAFNMLVAQLVAMIIVAIIIAVLSASVIGAVFIATLALIDAILYLICELTDADSDSFLCLGITGTVTMYIAQAIYQYNIMTDLDHDDRMAVSIDDVALVNDDPGFQVTNQVTIQGTVTNTLYIDDDTVDSIVKFTGSSYLVGVIAQSISMLVGVASVDEYIAKLNQAAFVYYLQESETDQHGSINPGDVSWIDTGYDIDFYNSYLPAYYQDFSFEGTFEFATPGVNEPLPIYFTEAANVPAVECWSYGLWSECKIKEYAYSSHSDLSEDFAFDVFPATFEEFYALVSTDSDNTSFAQDWDDTFPTLYDADGDGLISQSMGGVDPNDSLWDTDGDGLSDYWEYENGYDFETADGDGDGLSDYWEVFFYTDAYDGDTDGDGLTDGEEVYHPGWVNAYDNEDTTFSGGWTIVFDDAGNETRIQSDPNDYDYDADGIMDNYEYIYGYNPNLSNELLVLDLEAVVSLPNYPSVINYVKPGDTISYEATVKNQLDNRYARGLMEVELPVDVVQKQDPFGILAPLDEASVNGALQVDTNLQNSLATSMTIRAGALIDDLTADQLVLLQFDGDYDDSTILGNDATCSGTDCPAISNGVATFDGNDRLTIPYDSDFNLTAFSIGMWVKPTAQQSTWQDLIIRGSTSRNFTLGISPNSWKLFTSSRDASCSGTYWTASSNTELLQSDQWNHVMATYNGSDLTLYLNGVEIASRELSSVCSTGGDNIVIGSGGFTGSMDQVEIYDYALTSGQVEDLVKAPVFHLSEWIGGPGFDSSIYENFLYDASNFYEKIGVSEPSATTGIVGNGLSFDESHALKVTAQDHLALGDNSNEFTLSTWLYPKTSYTPDADHFTKYGQVVLGYTGSDYNTAYPTLYVKGQQVMIRFGHADGAGYCEATSSSELTYNAWQHVAVTFNGSQFSLYKDGELVDTFSGSNCAGESLYFQNYFYIGHGFQPAIYFDKLDFDDNGSGEDENEQYIYTDGDVEDPYSGSEADNNQYVWARWGMQDDAIYSIDNWVTTQGESIQYWLCEREIEGDLRQNCQSDDEEILNELLTYYQTGAYSVRSTVRRDNDPFDETLHYNVYNNAFEGYLDEIRLYRTALEAADVADLYSGDLRALEIKFDEAPGDTVFRDYSGNDTYAYCTSDSACPDSGLPGRNNQTARFDGNNDYLTTDAEVVDLATDDFTIGAWVKTTGNKIAIVSKNDGDTSWETQEKVFYLDGSGRPYFVGYGNGYIKGNTAVNDDNWHHVAVVWDYSGSGTSGSGKIYVDGVEATDSSGYTANNADHTSHTLKIGYPSFGEAPNYFTGLMDELVIIQEALSQSEIEALMQESPVFNLHLDEELNATTFSDDSYANDATCAGNTCPLAGLSGQMREAVQFDGSNDYLSTGLTPDQLSLYDHSFTVMSWLKLFSTSGDQPIIGTDKRGTAREGLHLVIRNGKPHFGFWSQDTTGSSTLNTEQWYHVAFVYDKDAETQTIYLNGVQDAQGTNKSAFIGSDTVQVGKASNTNYLDGLLDELAIYGTALDADEVDDIYEYQAAWYDVAYQQFIYIDADKPIVYLDLNTDYISPDPGRIMAIYARDETTNIESVQYKVDNGTWHEATADGEAWTFTYDAIVPGPHTVEVRATDSVGNVNISRKTFQVDGEAPTVSLTTNTSVVQRVGDSGYDLAGTVSDTQSQVDPSSIWVNAKHADGQSVSGYKPALPADGQARIAPPSVPPNGGETGGARKKGRARPLPSNNFNWQATYPFPPNSYGEYSIHVSAADRVGNTVTQTVGTVKLDNFGPKADIALKDLTISDTNKLLRGTVSDIIYPPNSQRVRLHFEDDSAATEFADSSSGAITATCTNCPARDSSGSYGTALAFDGVDDTVWLNDLFINPATENFTAMAWFKLNGIGSQQVIFQQVDDGKTWLFVNGSGQLASNLGGGGGQAATVGTWHHAAMTYDGSNLKIYLDGQQISSVATTPATSSGSLAIGSNRGGSAFFNGSIDEVVIYDRTLEDSIIYNIANPLPTHIANLQLRFRHASGSVWPNIDPAGIVTYLSMDGREMIDLSHNALNVSCNDCPRAGHLGKQAQAVSFDGANNAAYLAMPSSLSGNTSFSVAFWMKYNPASQRIWIMDFGRRGRSTDAHWLIGTSGQAEFGFWSGTQNQFDLSAYQGQWVHVATVYDADAQTLTSYLNGNSVDTDSVTDTPNLIADQIRLGLRLGNEANYNGLLDEVVIFNKALAGDEVKRLLISPWRTANLSNANSPFSTWQYSLSEGLEGPFKIDLFAIDSVGNHSYLPTVWSGGIDTLAPLVTLDYTALGSNYAWVRCQAEDGNLSTDGWDCPGDLSPTTETYLADDWLPNTFSGADILTGLSTDLQTVQVTDSSMTACDAAGHCTTASAQTVPGGASDNLRLWLKADAGTNTTTDGATVSGWTDYSGNGYIASQSSTADQPTYLADSINGNPAIRFDGSSDALTIANGLFGTATHNDLNVYLVARTNVKQNSTTFFEAVSPQRVLVHLPYQNNDRVFWDAGQASGDYRLFTDWGEAELGTPYLWSFLYSTGSTAEGNKQDILRNGLNLVNDQTASSFTGQGNDFVVGSDAGTGYFNGDIAELIIYDGPMTSDEASQIESYLALKYGLTLEAGQNYIDSLGNTVWNATNNSSYHHNVAGIGRDDNSGLAQTTSKSVNSEAIVTMANGSDLSNPTAIADNLSFLMWGHDGQEIGTTLIQTGAVSETAPVSTYTRLSRVWRVQATDWLNEVSLSFDLTGLGLSPDSAVVALLVDSDTDFSDATLHTTGRSVNGDTVSFTNVNFADGDTFTLLLTEVAPAATATPTETPTITPTPTETATPAPATSTPTPPATPVSGENVYQNVSEANDYTLVYALDIPANANYGSTDTPAYTVDNSASVGNFDRVAYYLELDDGSETQWAYVSMAAFATDASKIGVPVEALGVTYDQAVNNMNVKSNVTNVTDLDGISTGYLEFWHNCYQKTADSGIGGSSDLFDVDDTITTASCYGSFQIHNTGTSETILAWNRWAQGNGNDDIGIYNRDTNHPDWTFAQNAGDYLTRTLYVLVRETQPTPTPTLTPTETGTPTATITPTETATPAPADTETPTPTVGDTETPTPASADTDTPTPAPVDTDTPTPAPVDTETPTPAPVDTETPTPANRDSQSSIERNSHLISWGNLSQSRKGPEREVDVRSADFNRHVPNELGTTNLRTTNLITQPVIDNRQSKNDSRSRVVTRREQVNNGFSLILTPTMPAVVTSLQPVVIGGYVSSTRGINSLAVTLNGASIHKENWPAGTTEANWSTTWTPPGEGRYNLASSLTIGTGEVITDPTQPVIYVDVTDPAVTIETTRLSQVNFQAGGIVITGTVSDTVGIKQLQAQLNGGPWRNVPLPTEVGTTNYTASLVANGQPQTTYTVTVRAIDRGNHTVTAQKVLAADTTAPAAFNITLISAGQTVTPGGTIDWAKNPTLVANWSNSADAVSYRVEWLEYKAGRWTVVQSNTVATTSDSYQAGEPQKVRLQVTAIDGVGNEVTQEAGPFYVDYGTTPVYSDLTGFQNLSGLGSDTGWLNNACNLIGQDNRMENQQSALSAINQTQQFYTAWDDAGLRLSWVGADWQHQGDLFIYLDTRDGGSTVAYNPYQETMTNVGIFLPTDQETNQQLAADYLIWVHRKGITQTVTVTDEEGNQTEEVVTVSASLLSWDEANSDWAAVDGEWYYDFRGLQTDLYVPFSRLGITNPASQSLALVALASEEDGLRVWATMPSYNNLNSEEVIGQLANDEVETFTLLKKYQWASLGSDICPSGVTNTGQRSRQAGSDTIQFNGADLSAFIVADPNGVGYGLFRDHMIFAHDKLFPEAADWENAKSTLCGGQPLGPLPPGGTPPPTGTPPPGSTPPPPGPQARQQATPPPPECNRAPSDSRPNEDQINVRTELARIFSVEHPKVANGQTINYTVQVVNDGQQPADGVVVFVTSPALLRLTQGQLINGPTGGQLYEYRVVVGTLAVSETREIAFQGTVDTNFNSEQNDGWVRLKVAVFDETGSRHQPAEELHLDHELDETAPDYVELQSPVDLIGSGQHPFQGFVNDQSAVPTILLELNGQPQDCANTADTASQWRCLLDVGSLNDGDILTTRLKAIDKFQHESDWFRGPTLIADTIPPVISLTEVTSNTLSDTLIGPQETGLTGELIDNRLVGRVEVCQQSSIANRQSSTDACQQAELIIDPTTLTPTTFIYHDDPGTAIVVGSNSVCGSNEIIRTFNVTDSFTIADVDVGLTLEHPFRNDAIAWLQSPAGTRVELLSKGSDNANFDVLLNDAALVSVFLDYDLTDHNINPPYFDNERQPYAGQLAKFRGEEAQGTWTLQLCDNYPPEDDGLYHRSQLIMRAANVQADTAATWQYNLVLPDNVEQETMALTVYGYDSVNNRSEPINLTFEIDTKQPVISVTETTPFSQPVMARQRVVTPTLAMSGTVSDAYTPTMRLRIRTPNGDFKSARIDHQQGRWVYTDTSRFNRGGLYCLWVEAEDQADNLMVEGPYALQATVSRRSIIVGGEGDVYLPLVLRQQNSPPDNDGDSDDGDQSGNERQATGPHTLYLPVITSGDVTLPPPSEGGETTSQIDLTFVEPVRCR